MPNDVFFKAMNTGHRLIRSVSRGRLGWNAGSMPVLELTTVGRKSGEKRTVFLTTPVQKDGSLLIVASKGGEQKHPAWFHNLRATPEVDVNLEGASRKMTARVVSDEERSELWPRVTAAYKGYAGYQKKTDRQIPLVWLDPTSS
ncbi:MAG TPA: nitroreductase family deazaflavin-dependent oxidoreductase [Acidimicrobiaceae bacterium]|nr:nitroreductase family deazaflavin-dependent oxidoreductase [Acidimicrobiaceae bacterium]